MENSKENDLFTEKVCITCLSKEVCENIFILNFEDTRFAYIFNTCMGFELNEDSELKHMCFECINMIISFYTFQKSALKSYAQLNTKFIKRETVKENEDKELKEDEANILKCVSQEHESLVGCIINNDISESNTIEIVRIEDENMVETVKLEGEIEFINCEEKIKKIKCKEDSIDEIKETNNKSMVSKTVTKTNKLLWNCSYCPLSFPKSDLVEIKKHRYMEKQKRLKVNPCPVCNKKFTTHKLKEHVLRHGPVKPMKCEICGKGVSSVFTLKKHMMLHEGKRFSCNICGKGFTEQFLLKVHMNGHENPDKTYLCSTCGASLWSPLQLSRHKYEHSRKTKESERLVCTVCGKCFSGKAALEVHLASTHDKVDLYECARCGKKFGHRSRLTTHMWYHMAEHRCHACFKIYKYDDLRTHDCKPLPKGTVFTDHLPNECKQCGEILQRGDLARHMKRHDGRECKICGEVVYGARKLMFHKNTHLLRCDLCKKGFAKKNSLLLHTANKVCERKNIFSISRKK